MIVGDRKPFEEIRDKVEGCARVLLLGCETCVSVCMVGGEKEVELLASQLRMAGKLNGRDVEVGEVTLVRQCDREYIEPIVEKARDCDAVLSMACGAGVQLVADVLAPLPVVPAVNTRFIGVAEAEGTWVERCRACGNCIVGEYAGVCPIARCPKGILNGPCGGSSGGRCETDSERECAWALILDRLSRQGKADSALGVVPPRDFRTQDNPARRTSEAYAEPEEAEER